MEVNLIKEGISLLQKGKCDEAIEILLRAKRIAPKDYLVWYVLGLAYRMNNQDDKAIDCFFKVIEFGVPAYDNRCFDYFYEKYPIEEPKGYLVWFKLGEIYFLNGKCEEAIDCYLKAMRYSPIIGYNLYGEIGDAYLKIGNIKEAMDSFSKCREIDGERKMKLAHMYYSNGQFNEAAETLLKYIKVKSDKPIGYSNTVAYHFLVYLYLTNEQYKEAINYFLQSLYKYESLGAYYERYINCMAMEYEYENIEWQWNMKMKIKEYYKGLISGLLNLSEANPNNHIIFGLLGTSYFMNGQYKEAIDALLKSTGMKHENYTAWNLLGASYYKTEQREDAIEAFLTAEALGGDKDFCQFMLCKLDASSKAKEVEEPKDNIILKILNEDKQ